jgi:hypothetical protein
MDDATQRRRLRSMSEAEQLAANKLTAGATEYFEHIGSEIIQRVNAEFATRRKQFRRTKLRWRVSRGSKRSLGWVPFKAARLKRKGKSLRFSGKAFRVFERELLEAARWKSGCFAQDGQVRTGCRLGYAQDAVALQGPAGRQERYHQ